MKQGIILIFILLLTACARPEIEETAAPQDTQETVQSDSLSEPGSLSETEQQLMQDNGRHISKTAEGQDYTIEIDADVEVFADQMYKGEVTIDFPAVEEIEALFTDGRKMEIDEEESNDVHTSWSLVAEGSSDTAFILSYSVDSDSALYTNASVQTFDGDYTGLETIHEDAFSSEETVLYEDCCGQAFL